MALTAEQQAQVDFEEAMSKARSETMQATEITRFKIDAIRMAKEIAFENSRIADAGTLIKSSDVTAIADDFIKFVTV